MRVAPLLTASWARSISGLNPGSSPARRRRGRGSLSDGDDAKRNAILLAGQPSEFGDAGTNVAKGAIANSYDWSNSLGLLVPFAHNQHNQLFLNAESVDPEVYAARAISHRWWYWSTCPPRPRRSS